jgi:hypothetical protein
MTAAPEWNAVPPASYLVLYQRAGWLCLHIEYLWMWALWSQSTEYGGCTKCVRRAIWLLMVPEGRNSAASLPVICFESAVVLQVHIFEAHLRDMGLKGCCGRLVIDIIAHRGLGSIGVHFFCGSFH